jgi:hypothetical protein
MEDLFDSHGRQSGIVLRFASLDGRFQSPLMVTAPRSTEYDRDNDAKFYRVLLSCTEEESYKRRSRVYI